MFPQSLKLWRNLQSSSHLHFRPSFPSQILNLSNHKLITLQISPFKSVARFSTAKSQYSLEYHPTSTRFTSCDRDLIEKLDKVKLPPIRIPGDDAPFYDRFAYRFVKLLRKSSNLFFRQKYVHYACVLETVAAVPGMVAGMLNHLRSLRKLEHNNWIKILLDEAENERMHLMTFMEIAQPNYFERMLVALVQFGYFSLYSLIYISSAKTAHRIVGYLEQEAVISYTNMLKDIDANLVPNYPAPQIAIEYWGLPKSATLRDVIVVIRADEMDHREVNHTLSDFIEQGKDHRHSIEIGDVVTKSKKDETNQK